MMVLCLPEGGGLERVDPPPRGLLLKNVRKCTKLTKSKKPARLRCLERKLATKHLLSLEH